MPAGHLAALAFVISSALAGSACTSASFGDPVGFGSGSDDGGGGTLADGGGPVAPMPDAAPGVDAGTVTLTQSGSLDVIGFTARTCFDNQDVEQVNSFYRVFDLAALGIGGPLHVTRVTFGVEECVSAGTGLPATVVLHWLDGDFSPSQPTFALADLRLLGSAPTLIPDVTFPPEGQAGGIMHSVPIADAGAAPAGSRLVVELTHPALDAGQILLMGSNRLDQDGFTYTRAAACEVGAPTNIDTIPDDDLGGLIVMHWVLVVEGTSE